jgi:polysaccharide biosynthesis transport protein
MFSGKGDSPSRRGNSLLRFAEDKIASARDHDDPRLVSNENRQDAAERHRRARTKRERVDNVLLSELAKRPENTEPFEELEQDEPIATTSQPTPRSRGPEPTLPSRSAVSDALPLPGILSKLDEIDAAFARRARSSTGSQTKASDEETVEAPQFNDDASSEWRPLINPRFILEAIRRFKAPIFALGLLGATAGVMIALTTPKFYYASAEVSVDPRGLKVIDNGVNPDTFISETFAIVDSQLRVMTSPAVLERVAKELNLASDVEFNGSLKEGWLESVSGILSRRDANNDTTRAATEYLVDHVFVERGAKTYVIMVTAASEDPEKAALIANKLVEVYISEQRMQQSKTVKETTDDLTNRLEDLKAAVENSEQKVEAYKSENDLIGAEGRMIDDEAILRVNDQLSAARGQTISFNARAKSIRDLSPESVLNGGIPEELNSSVLTALRSQYSSAKQKRDGIATKLGPRHPERIQAESELDSLRSSIGSELRRVSASMQTDLKRAIQTEQDLAARLAELKARQGNMGEDLVKLRELQRESDANRSVYEAFLLRARQTGEQIDLNTSNIKVIASARPPRDPIGTSRKLIVAVGLLSGLGLGVALAVLKGILDSLRSQPTRPAVPQSARLPVDTEPRTPTPSGGGMFRPRAKPSARVAPQPAPPFAPATSYAPAMAAPQVPATMPLEPNWQIQAAAPHYATPVAQPAQYWPHPPQPAFPQAMVPPGPLMYPVQLAQAHAPFVPQMPQSVPVGAPWMQAMLQQQIQPPVQLQMPAYAPHPGFAAPIAESRPAPIIHHEGNLDVADIKASIHEIRSALTDFARRRTGR